MRIAAILAAVAALVPQSASASAWPLQTGTTQVILKTELERGGVYFDGEGRLVRGGETVERRLSIYAEHGLSPAVTLLAQAGLEQGQEGPARHDGLSSTQLGLKYTALDGAGYVASLCLSVAAPGVHKANRFDPAGEGGNVEVRALVGKSFQINGRAAYLEVQAARLAEFSDPDQVRLDVTFGLDVWPGWTWMVQGYAGRTEAGRASARWLKLDQSLTRRWGDWRVQAGWRMAIAGANIPASEGPLLALWRSF